MTTKYEIRCYGDGALGHQHTRESCARILRDAAYSCGWYDRRNLTSSIGEMNKALLGEMSDDASEEDEACDWLNTHATVDGASWGWRDGDFGLWPNEEE